MNPMAVPPIQPAAPAEAILTPPVPLDRWQALRQAGWWTNFDFVLLFLASGTGVTGIFWKIFADPGLLQLISLFLVVIIIFQIWSITVLYRCMDFVLQLRANIELLPFDSARIAVGYLQGGKPLETPVRR